MSSSFRTDSSAIESHYPPAPSGDGRARALQWLSQASSQERYAAAVLDATLQAVNGLAGSLMLRGPAPAELRVVAARGPRQRHVLGAVIPFGAPIAGQVAASRTLLHVPDINADAHLVATKCQGRRAQRYGGSSFISVPLLAADQLMGVLNVSSRASAQFTREDAAYLGELSTGIAESLAHLPTETPALADVDMDGFGAILQFAAQSDRAPILQIFNLVDQAVVCFDESGRVMWMNAAAETLFDCPGTGPGRTLGSLPVTVPSGNWADWVATGLANGRIHPLEEVAVTPPGSPASRVVSCRGALARHDSGALAGGCLVLRDQTQAVRLAQQATAAEKRTAMGDLLAEVAHELNSPLDSTRRLLKLAQREGIDPGKATEYLQDAMSAMDRMVGIVSKVLAFSRQENAPLAAPQSLSQVLDAYFHELAVTGRYPNVRVVRDYHDLGPILPCTDFTAIVDNLVRNACDAMRYTGTIVVYGQKRTRDYILEIQDTGPGISPELQTRIFDPFFTTKPYGQGTGLGLALCRKILEPHGATLTCSSEVGVGTTFRLVLPLPPAAESQPA